MTPNEFVALLSSTFSYILLYRHYDVIVTELGKDPTFPRKNPGDYSNQDIILGMDGLYVAGRIKDKSQFGKEFQIGGGKPGKDNRKRRALASKMINNCFYLYLKC